MNIPVGSFRRPLRDCVVRGVLGDALRRGEAVEHFPARRGGWGCDADDPESLPKHFFRGIWKAAMHSGGAVTPGRYIFTR